MNWDRLSSDAVSYDFTRYSVVMEVCSQSTTFLLNDVATTVKTRSILIYKSSVYFWMYFQSV